MAKVMIALLWLSLWVSLAVQASGQSVLGVVKDSLTQAPVAFATVTIRVAGKDSVAQSTVTDEKGRFMLLKVKAGDFDVLLTAAGYNAMRLPLGIPPHGAVVMDLGTIFLKPRPEMLKDVVVNGKRALIEEKLDRTVYDVERDKSLTGGDATDALRRVPLLSVDIDGNVRLRGSANIKVLINGRPSTITASNLADALKQIPVDEIKSVEVITSPSVKYDADGSAGIINIVLKQDRLHGILINPDMALGTRASFLGIDGAYNNKKMSFSMGGFGRATYAITGIYDNVQQVGSQAISQEAGTRKKELTDNYSIGWEYDIDSSNFLNTSLRYSQLNSHRYQDNLVSQFYSGSMPDSMELNEVAVTGLSGTVDATMDLTHAFGKSGRELSLLTLFSTTDGRSGFTNAQEDPQDAALIGQIANGDRNSDREMTLQVDYQTPLDSGQVLAFGGKYIIRQVTSDYYYATAGGNGPLVVEPTPELTNRFTYHQNVSAGYVEYSLLAHSPISMRVGGRYEYAMISGGLNSPGVVLPAIPSYGAFIPAVNFGWRLTNGKLIKLGVTRRIQRPSIQYLNPDVVAPGPGSILTGNPSLRPEYSDNVEVGYNTAIGNMSIGLSAFYRRTTGAIESINLPIAGGDTIERTYANIGTEQTGGIDVFGNLDIKRKLSLSGGADVYYTELNGGTSGLDALGRHAGWVITGRLSGGYTFAKGWSLYLYSYYRGSQVLLQGYQTGIPYYSLTFKHALMRKRGTIGLGAENFLSRRISVTTKVNSTELSQSTTNSNNTASFRVYMSFTLGKLKVEREQRQTKAIINDDLKKG
jgi:outer membrane receptor protein involved in Fe transport